MAVAGSRPVPMPLWFRETGAEMDVVVSTRCRIARNLNEYRFPGKATAQELADTARECLQAVTNMEPLASVYDRESLAGETAGELAFMRYVTLRWAAVNGPGAVLVHPGGVWSVMVNEEDHLRIQSVVAGSEAEKAMRAAGGLADRTEGRLVLAKRADLGFLTSSLSNVGTGMRLSFLLHLPALAELPEFEATLAAAEHMGCSVRGAFGEGTRGTGALVQVSNRCTWGESAERSAGLAQGAVRYLVGREREARGTLLARAGGKADLVAACEGAQAALLHGSPDGAELLRCVSVLRLGRALGVIPGDLLRTGEWIALAGVSLVARMRGGTAAERFAQVRALARIRRAVRETACVPDVGRQDGHGVQ